MSIYGHKTADDLAQIFIYNIVFIEQYRIIRCSFSQERHCFIFMCSIIYVCVMIWQNENMTITAYTCCQQGFLQSLDGFFAMWNNRVYHAISFYGFAFDYPVCIRSYFTFIDENKREVSCHFSIIIISRRVHIIIKVGSIEGFLNRNLLGMRFCVIMYLLFNVYSRSLL